MTRRLRAPTQQPIWCVQHLGTHGPITNQHDTEQAATHQWAHLTATNIPAVMWHGTVIHETNAEEQAA